MATITVRDDEPEFGVERTETGDVRLTIRADSTTFCLAIGPFHDSVSVLAESLRHLAEDIDDTILDGWEDTPDEHDGYIVFDRGRFHVSLEGAPVGHGYPSQDVAEIELARAMVTAGVFTNAWFITDHGNHVAINDSIRAWHDAGGDAMAPLPGVQYEPGDRVQFTGTDWPYVVIGDWGPAGVEIHTDGDPTIRSHVTDRSELQRLAD